MVGHSLNGDYFGERDGQAVKCSGGQRKVRAVGMGACHLVSLHMAF